MAPSCVPLCTVPTSAPSSYRHSQFPVARALRNPVVETAFYSFSRFWVDFLAGPFCSAAWVYLLGLGLPDGVFSHKSVTSAVVMV